MAEGQRQYDIQRNLDAIARIELAADLIGHLWPTYQGKLEAIYGELNSEAFRLRQLLGTVTMAALKASTREAA